MRRQTPTPSPHERRQDARAAAGRMVWDVALVCVILALGAIALGVVNDYVLGSISVDTEEEP